MTKLFPTLVAAALLVPLAIAHPQVYTVDVATLDGDERYYVSSEHGVWQESNGLLHSGVNSFANAATGMRGATGLQMHNVCFMAWTSDEIDQFNWDASDGHYGYDQETGQGTRGTNRLYHYVGFEGTPIGCDEMGGVFHEADTRVASP